MALPTRYNVGTATVAANGTAVTGQGTAWAAALKPGDLFGVHRGLSVPIASINSNTSLTLAYSWPGAAQSAAAYDIQLTPPSVGVMEGVRVLLEQLGNGNLQALAGLTSAADRIAYFNGPGSTALANFTAIGRSFLALTGGGAGKLPILNGATGVSLRDLVGTVAQAGGVPTGSIIERGSNANGEYVRCADGTQICSRKALDFGYLAAPRLGALWVFPASFASPPAWSWSWVSSTNDLNNPYPNASFSGNAGLNVTGVAENSALNLRCWPVGFSFSAGSTINADMVAFGRWF